ncbi:hypothetical protein B0I35DRAFT_434620 [Stachybotrys elegans]|uniref:DUF7580 domain-containing protein n=1 Tax=Stachybotrys elegans TaxID=80388 RepID=A0A8K0SL78_9HYPO|nr:hypothetical protein B0I35DRAFT_434620 [Stachybotrys elegans]
MSGFEIAGLALGAFPILGGVAKDSKSVLEKARSWWTFETTFSNFIADLATQEIAYRQVLKRLAEPLPLSDIEYDKLISDPNSTLWNDAHIQQSLRQRLPGTEYQWFMENLKDIYHSIVDLQKLLPLNKIYHLDSTSLESEIYRLQTSFSNDKTRLLGRITAINDKLHQYLDRAPDTLPQQNTKPKLSFRELQDQAHELYQSLVTCWQCNCPDAHNMGIMANPPSKTRRAGAGYFNILFEGGREKQQFRLLIKSKSSSEESEVSPQIDLEAVGTMQRQMRLKEQDKRVEKFGYDSSIGSLVAASSQFLVKPSESSEGKVILKQAPRKLQRRSASRNVDQYSLAVQSNLGSSTGVPINSTPISFTLDSAPGRSQSGPETLTDQNPAPSRVRFAIATRSEYTSISGNITNEIDMCLVAAKRTTASAKPVLSMNEGAHAIFEHDPADQGPLQGYKKQDIDDILRSTPSRVNRLYLGLRLAFSLLGLANSEWVPRTLQKEKIFLIRDQEPGGALLGPYISFSSRDMKQPTSRLWHARPTLFLLGVTILELFFGEVLERQSSWEDSLENGQVNEQTMFCSAFLWVGRAENAMKSFYGTEVGGTLTEAIRKCICYDFGCEDEIGTAQLVDAVYNHVIVPLERCCPQRFQKV